MLESFEHGYGLLKQGHSFEPRKSLRHDEPGVDSLDLFGKSMEPQAFCFLSYIMLFVSFSSYFLLLFMGQFQIGTTGWKFTMLEKGPFCGDWDCCTNLCHMLQATRYNHSLPVDIELSGTCRADNSRLVSLQSVERILQNFQG